MVAQMNLKHNTADILLIIFCPNRVKMVLQELELPELELELRELELVGAVLPFESALAQHWLYDTNARSNIQTHVFKENCKPCTSLLN